MRAARMAGALFLALAALASCANESAVPAAPPRATDPIIVPKENSQMAVDLRVDLADLEAALNRDIPRQLWQIDRPGSECVPSKKVDLELFKVKTPKIKCRIVGKVTRGRVRLTGRGEALVVTMPIKGTVAARDIAGILKGETATGAAEVSLSLALDLTPDWKLKGKSKVNYRWTRTPGIDFLGRRITFTSDADRELAPLKRDAEKIIARELSRIPLKPLAQEGWREAHQVFELNRRNPPVWGRLTPQQFRFGGYEVKNRELSLRLGLEALFETFIGRRPDKIAPASLPALARRDKSQTDSILHVPVVAEYAVLEPVIAKALAKRSARPFVIKDYGSVIASFDKITVYGTTGGRIAVGAAFKASSDLPLIKAASGTIWLTARPENAPGSRLVRFMEVKVSGETDMIGQDFLFALANSPEFQGAITTALQQNFENDFAKLRVKIDRAIANRKGRLTDYSATIDKVETGVIRAHGEGLYLPVDITARLSAKLRRLD
ncbi:MAG: hypothetical protein RIT17_677 [Pseudomonadota bacterium]